MPGCASKSRKPAADARMLWLCILLPRFAPEASAGGRPQAERAALEVLALWALQWSSRVSYRVADGGERRTDPVGGSVQDSALWIEIGASGRLFGGHAALRERIAADLVSLGYTIAGRRATPEGAALLARAGLAIAATRARNCGNSSHRSAGPAGAAGRSARGPAQCRPAMHR